MVATSAGVLEVQRAAPKAEMMVWRTVERLAQNSVGSMVATSANKMAARLAARKGILKVAPTVGQTAG